MHTMQNVHNMQNSLLLTERTSALWAVYGYFYQLEPVIISTAVIWELQQINEIWRLMFEQDQRINCNGLITLSC